MSYAEKVRDFLAGKRFAVAGVSRKPVTEVGNAVYRRLEESGYEVFPVNPRADEIDGHRCYPDLRSVPGPLDGVVVATRPEVAEEIARQCVDLGIPRIWFHRSIGTGSYSPTAAQLCEENGIAVLRGGCPLMHLRPDIGHRCMRVLFGLTGRLA